MQKKAKKKKKKNPTKNKQRNQNVESTIPSSEETKNLQLPLLKER